MSFAGKHDNLDRHETSMKNMNVDDEDEESKEDEYAV
jgi:hypothetical protein